MNTTKFAIAAIFAAASFSSMAAPANTDMPSVTVSSSGLGPNSGEGYMGYTGFVSGKTRAQVIQELQDAQRRGEIYSGENYPGPLVAPSTKTRAEVVSELKEYRMTHPLMSDDGAFSF